MRSYRSTTSGAGQLGIESRRRCSNLADTARSRRGPDLPAAQGTTTRRTLYFYADDAVAIDGAAQPAIVSLKFKREQHLNW